MALVTDSQGTPGKNEGLGSLKVDGTTGTKGKAVDLLLNARLTNSVIDNGRGTRA